MAVGCPYCGKGTRLVTGAEVYPGRPELHSLPLYRCGPCDAHVGCHPGTTRPLGLPANRELRSARQAAHAAFDPLWRSGKRSRTAAYAWLAAKLDKTKLECHIGRFGLEDCLRVVELCDPRPLPIPKAPVVATGRLRPPRPRFVETDVASEPAPRP